MKRLFLLALLSLSTLVHSATYTRTVPAAVCIVQFGDHTVNAILIQDIVAGPMELNEPTGQTGTFSDKWRLVTKTAVRVRLVNGQHYYKVTSSVAEAEEFKTTLLKTIKTECGT